MTQPHTVTVQILDKDYLIACPPHQRANLEGAARYLDGKMREIRGSGKVIGAERIAVMAALNIAHEHLTHLKQADGNPPVEPAETVLDKALVKRRITDMETELDAVLAPQGKLL